MAKSTKNSWKKALEIVTSFEKQRGINLEDLKMKPSTRTFTRLRRELSDRLRRSTELSWSEIGDLLGRKNWRS